MERNTVPNGFWKSSRSPIFPGSPETGMKEENRNPKLGTDNIKKKEIDNFSGDGRLAAAARVQSSTKNKKLKDLNIMHLP